MSVRIICGLMVGVLAGGACGGSGSAGRGADSGVTAESARWDYVALGDSYTGFASWPEMYSEFIQQDLGIAVELHDEARPRQRADSALERMRTDERLRGLLAEAEVITVGWVGDELRIPVTTYVADDGTCGGDDNQDCIRAALGDVMADWDALLDELVAIRSPDDALITALDKGVFLAERFCEWDSDCWHVLAGYFVEISDLVVDTARQHGLRVADALDALHAPGVYEAPLNRAYVVADGVHFSEEGSAVVADVLRSLGYQ